MEISLSKINDVFSPKVRLGIMTLLAKHNCVDFKFLKTSLNLTDGKLGAHLKKLASLEFIEVKKVFEKGKPKSYYTITKEGRDALLEHVKYLEEIIKMIQE